MPVQLALNAGNLVDKRYVATCNAVTSCYYSTRNTATATKRLSW